VSENISDRLERELKEDLRMLRDNVTAVRYLDNAQIEELYRAYCSDAWFAGWVRPSLKTCEKFQLWLNTPRIIELLGRDDEVPEEHAVIDYNMASSDRAWNRDIFRELCIRNGLEADEAATDNFGYFMHNGLDVKVAVDLVTGDTKVLSFTHGNRVYVPMGIAEDK
jgi:hypothetical protein